MKQKTAPTWVRVVKNPADWRMPYSVEVNDRGEWLVYSQHRLLRVARANAQQVLRKFSSGHDALTTVSYSWLPRKRKRAMISKSR